MADTGMSRFEKLSHERRQALMRVSGSGRELAEELYAERMYGISSVFFGSTVDPGGHLEAFCLIDEAWRQERYAFKLTL